MYILWTIQKEGRGFNPDYQDGKERMSRGAAVCKIAQSKYMPRALACRLPCNHADTQRD